MVLLRKKGLHVTWHNTDGLMCNSYKTHIFISISVLIKHDIKFQIIR